jgi:hypothetical protein
MKFYRSILGTMLIVMTFAALTLAQASWVKLGEKDVDFKIDHDTIGAESKGNIRELQFRVMNAPIRFKKVVIHYKDGEKKEVEFLEELEVGRESRSVTIEGDGHPIKSVDVWYETDSLGGKKAKVAVYGR